MEYEKLKSIENARALVEYNLSEFCGLYRVEDLELVTESRFIAALRYAGRNIYPCRLYTAGDGFGGALSLCVYDTEVLAVAAALYVELCEVYSKVTSLYGFSAFSCVAESTLAGWLNYNNDSIFGPVVGVAVPDSISAALTGCADGFSEGRTDNGKPYNNIRPSNSLSFDTSLCDSSISNNAREMLNAVRQNIIKFVAGSRENALVNKLICSKGSGVNIIAILNHQYGWDIDGYAQGGAEVAMIESAALPELPLK